MDTKAGYIKKIVLVAVFVIFLLSIIVPVRMYNDFLRKSASNKSQDIEFRVHKGTNSNEIINGLYENGLVRSKLLAKIYLRNLNLDKNLKVGVYKFNTSMTPVEIFNKLLKGDLDPDIVYVTIPEGYTVKQIAEKIAKQGLIDSPNILINEAQNGKFEFSFLNKVPDTRPSRLEGYLFPDTYEFKKGISAHDILATMLGRFEYVYNSLPSPSGDAQNMSLDQIMIMASIVESEAKLDEERPKVSSVFYNRLNINMKLQSCATVEYSLGTHKDVLYNKDLQVDSPYNTYKYPGLPAGPICNPGKPSIEAALKPSATNYLYFVSKGNGSHFFTNSYNEFLNFQKTLSK